MSRNVSIRSMSVLAYAQGFTLWHYKGGEAALVDIARDGYFDTASDMLAVGDMLLIAAADGGKMMIVVGLRNAQGARKVVVAPFN